MKITGFNTINSNSGVNKRRGVGNAGGFADLLASSETSETTTTNATSDVAATSALSNLLALQEISEEDVHRRKLMQHGNNMLDSLEKLRRQVLGGAVSQHTLQDISRQLSIHKQTVMDPKLTEIIEDIELRTAVELAKLEMAAASMARPDLA